MRLRLRPRIRHAALPPAPPGPPPRFSDYRAGPDPRRAADAAAGASAVAAANVFHHSERSVVRAKRCLLAAGANVRPLSETTAEAAA